MQYKSGCSQLFYPLEQQLEPLPWRYDAEIAGAGLFFDLGSHMLDFWDYALGPIAAVEGRAASNALSGTTSF